MPTERRLRACSLVSVPPPSLYFKGELSCGSLRFPQPLTLVVSAHNPGAAALADELASEFNALTTTVAAENATGVGRLGRYEASERVA